MKRPATWIPVFAIATILVTSCAPRKALPPAEASPPHSWYWVELLAGWRVRVVTPVTQSGSFLVKTSSIPEDRRSSGSGRAMRRTTGAAVINGKATEDLIGYEVSFYSVKPRHGGGVQVSFRSASIIAGGKKRARPRPALALFRLPRNDRFVRILHFAWGNHGDHDAAILAASRQELLEALTRSVESDAAACINSQESACSWVPAGVAVIPEHKKSSGGKSQWTAAY